jgi:hypothetical protein
MHFTKLSLLIYGLFLSDMNQNYSIIFFLLFHFQIGREEFQNFYRLNCQFLYLFYLKKLREYLFFYFIIIIFYHYL